MLFLLRPSTVYTMYWAHQPPSLRRWIDPSPLPRFVLNPTSFDANNLLLYKYNVLFHK